MTYDLFGTWDQQDVYIGPYVYAHSNLTQTAIDMDLLWRNNINPQKVNMGFGFYGRSKFLSLTPHDRSIVVT
jgi:chitinase